MGVVGGAACGSQVAAASRVWSKACGQLRSAAAGLCSPLLKLIFYRRRARPLPEQCQQQRPRRAHRRTYTVRRGAARSRRSVWRGATSLNLMQMECPQMSVGAPRDRQPARPASRAQPRGWRAVKGAGRASLALAPSAPASVAAPAAACTPPAAPAAAWAAVGAALRREVECRGALAPPGGRGMAQGAKCNAAACCVAPRGARTHDHKICSQC